MGKKLFSITITGKRPADATPEKALELSRSLTQEEIGELWGISRQRVQQLIAKARKREKPTPDRLVHAQQLAEENQNPNDSLHRD